MSHDPGAIKVDRILSGGALLANHEWADQIGVIEKVWVEENKRAWCRARFSKNPLAEEFWRDVLDEIRRNVSVGYQINEYEIVQREEGEPEPELDTIRVTEWEPHEVSIVSVPADYTVGFREQEAQDGRKYAVRSVKIVRGNMAEPTNTPGQQPTNVGNGNGSTTTIQVQERDQFRKDESKRIREITAMGARFNCVPEAENAINQGQASADFAQWVLVERCNAQPVTKPQEVGMNQKEIKRYSIVKAIRELSDINNSPRLTGLELEASQAMSKILKKEPQGFYIPREVMFGSTRGPDLTVTGPVGPGVPPGQGAGNLVPTEFVLPLIEYLRETLVVRQAGATMLTGLQGNITIPRQTGPAIAYWLPETGTLTLTDQAFDQIALIPRRLSSGTMYSRQLVIQSSPDIEALIRSDLASVMARTMDWTALWGSGVAPIPRGIFNQPGINRWTFDVAGGQLLYHGYIQGVVSIGDAKVPFGSMAWIANWRAWGEGIGTPRFPQGVGIPVIADNNTCLGYPYLRTQQIPNAPTPPHTPPPPQPPIIHPAAHVGLVFFGSWNHLLWGLWDGTDIVVDPYTRAQDALIRVIVHEWADMNVRYPEAFAVSTDAGYGQIPFPLQGRKTNGPENQETHPPNNKKGSV